MLSTIVLFVFAIIASNVAAAPLTSRADCPPMIVVFARGTTELGGLGTIAGPPLQAALEKKVGAGNVKMMGVTAPAYAADIPGFLAGGSATGSKAMAKMAQQEMAQCPQSNIAIVGYSQGGQLVHNAAKMMPAAATAKMMAVIFGDPKDGSPVAGVPAENTLVVCHTGDNICEHGDLILAPHLTYGADTPKAAAFMASRMAKTAAA